MGYQGKPSAKGAYDAIVYIEGSEVVAEDSNGRKIASGVAGENNAAVINAAIQYPHLGDADGAGTVVFSGYHYLEDSIIMRRGVGFHGVEIGGSILKLSPDINKSILMDNPSDYLWWSRIGNFTINGNSENNAIGHGIEFRASGGAAETSFVYLDDIIVYNCAGDGIHLNSGYWHMIDRCALLQNNGIQLRSTSNVEIGLEIRRSIIESQVVGSNGVLVEGTGSFTRITDNHIEQAYGYALSLDGYYSHVTDNNFHGDSINTTRNCVIDLIGGSIRFDRNFVQNFEGMNDVVHMSGGYVSIIDNKFNHNANFSGMQPKVLDVIGATDIISNNKFNTNTSAWADIYINAPNCIVSENTISDAPDKGIYAAPYAAVICGNIISGNPLIGIRSTHVDTIIDSNNVLGVTLTVNRIVADGKVGINAGYPTKNSGSSTGTGSEQTIAHGLAAIPTGCKAWIKYLVGTRYITEMIPFDATNIYPTVTSGLAYEWRIE